MRSRSAPVPGRPLGDTKVSGRRVTCKAPLAHLEEGSGRSKTSPTAILQWTHSLVEKFSEVRCSEPTPNRYGLAYRDGAIAENRYNCNGPGRIRCEELLLAVATCYGLDFREFLAYGVLQLYWTVGRYDILKANFATDMSET